MFLLRPPPPSSSTSSSLISPIRVLALRLLQDGRRDQESEKHLRRRDKKAHHHHHHHHHQEDVDGLEAFDDVPFFWNVEGRLGSVVSGQGAQTRFFPSGHEWYSCGIPSGSNTATWLLGRFDGDDFA